MSEIAQQCGVSRATVQRALSGRTNVLPDTAARIRTVAAALGYDPAQQETARRLAYHQQGKTPTNYVIAYFIPQTSSEPYYMRVFNGIIDVLGPAGYDLLLISALHRTTDAIPPSIAHGHVDGAIFNNVLQLPLLHQLRETPTFRGRPMLSLFLPTTLCPAVLIDERGGAYTATSHLLELGHRRILEFWGSAQDNYFALQRSAGCRQACEDRGLNPPDVLFSFPPIHPSPDIEARYTVPLLQALEQDPSITAVLAPNDAAALPLIRTLRAQGYRLPEDMSLVGFDDIRRWDNDMGVNQLTTIHVPLEEMGRQAAEYMLARLQGQTTRDYSVTLPTHLVVRASTAPPR
jgi:LacI family transcriptional regulator